MGVVIAVPGASLRSVAGMLAERTERGRMQRGRCMAEGPWTSGWDTTFDGR